MLEQVQGWVNLVWNFTEPTIFLFILYIFFSNPTRRWNFFGYRPTAIMGVFDPELEKVVFLKTNNFWSFSQGGIYQDNVYATAAEVLQRELALPHNKFKLIYTKTLGKIRLNNKRLLTRARINAFSIYSQLRGKGYIAFFLRTNLKGVKDTLKKGAGIEELRILTFKEARELTDLKCNHEEHQERKRDMIISMINEMEKFSQDEKKWKKSRETQEKSK